MRILINLLKFYKAYVLFMNLLFIFLCLPEGFIIYYYSAFFLRSHSPSSYVLTRRTLLAGSSLTPTADYIPGRTRVKRVKTRRIGVNALANALANHPTLAREGNHRGYWI